MQPILTLIFVAIIGWLAGIFVNYISDVFPWKRSFSSPFCLFCQEPLTWKNYLLWPRRCPGCTSRRNMRVWIIEISYILISIALWNFPPNILGYWLGLGLLIFFGVVVVIDIEYRLILHQVSIFGGFFAAILGIFWRVQQFANNNSSGLISTDAWWYAIWTTLLGGLLGFGVMWILYAGGEIFVRFLAKRRGQSVDEVALGFGDVNLAGVLGLLLGWPVIVLSLFLAVLIGGLISLVYILIMILTRRYHLFMALPYGPFLVFGAVIIIYFPEILRRLMA